MFIRLILFVAMNALVMAVITILSAIFGIDLYGTGYGQMFFVCFLYGMIGSFISLQMSRWAAKRAMGVKVLEPTTNNRQEQWLVSRVHEMAREAGMKTMPEVGVYQSPQPNAFATGPSKNRALVAVSTGLLQRMNNDQVEGVLAHEVAHIANGDMVTMALLQGIVNAVVMFLARVIAMAIDNALRSNNNRGGGLGYWGYFAVVMVLQMVLMIPGMMVMSAFSRWREFRADHGGAILAGKDKMRSALQALQKSFDIDDPVVGKTQKAFAMMKISGKNKGWTRLLASHPPLEERIRRLQ